MKLLFLIPPSEGKNTWWNYSDEDIAHFFEKPIDISINATQKDLKCIDKRYEEAIHLNKGLSDSNEYIESIQRYSWVMYYAIDYTWMNNDWKEFFENNFLILSWMYGLLKPSCKIGNYKLPIDTKWLVKFWWDKITEKVNELQPDYIVNLLPISYFKLIHQNKLNTQVIHINFLTQKDSKIVKVSHWVKKIKWEWIKNICENKINDYTRFWWEVVEWENEIKINILHW